MESKPACNKCDGNGWVCVRCKQSDACCTCPYGLLSGGKKPGVKKCDCKNQTPTPKPARSRRKAKP